MEVALDGSTEENGFFHLDERFKLANEVNISEHLSLASNRTNFEQIYSDESEGSEAENQEDDTNEDDRDEPVYFNYSDPDEEECGSIPVASSSPFPDPSGLPRIPLIGGSVPGPRSSPLPDPSGLPRIPLTGGSVPRARSSPLPDPSGHPLIPLTIGSVPGARSSPFPDPSGLPCIPLTGGSVPRVGSSPLSDPSGLPRIPLTRGSVPGSESSPLPDPSGLPCSGFVSEARSSPLPDPNLSGLQHNPFLVGSASRSRSSSNPNGLPHIPLLGDLSCTSVRMARSLFSGSSSMGDINTHMGLTDAIADTGVVHNGGNGIAYGYEMAGNNEDTTSDFLYNRPEHEHEPEHGHESMHEPESPMVQTPHYSCTHGGSNDADLNGSHRPFITRKGYKFGRQSIHRAILKIFWQFINEPWITYRKIPKEVVTQMFERFRTQYRWDPNEEGIIREGFENTLKDRYRGRMMDAREASESYNKALSKKYGDDSTQHNVNDPELWTQTQLLRKGGKQKGPIYGAGYSDLHFLMTGTYSYESTSASADFEKSQQEGWEDAEAFLVSVSSSRFHFQRFLVVCSKFKMCWLSAFDNPSKSLLDDKVVAILMNMLTAHNEYVRTFKTARDLVAEKELVSYTVFLFNDVPDRRHSPPTAGSLGCIVLGDDCVTNKYIIIVHSRSGKPQRISKLHPSYMVLQYPLLFPYGENGWSPHLKQSNETGVNAKNLTVNMYYSYHIHARYGVYSLLLNVCRLFQQYLVDA
ncbi:unnamed protein product [Lactuca saligna]|uniref:Uncharacterized protein n=1 Tax=Lactuca saligna TaxID=75948 RepID=A0AA35ZBV3_LACSI|nr:unnamed protein product [Lactuca saligna]